MANALDGILRGAGGILKGAGDIAGGAINEVGEFGRRYTYGPYYKENQDLARQKALSSLESDKSTRERNAAYAKYLENGGARRAGGTNSNDASFSKGQAIYNKALNDKNTYELTVKNNPGMKSDPKVVEQFKNQMKVGLDMQSRYSLPAEPGKPRSPGPPIGGVDSTALGYPPQRNPSVFNQPPPGALGGIAQPPRLPQGQPSPAMNNIATQAQRFLNPTPELGGIANPAAVGGQSPRPPIGGVDSTSIGTPPQTALGNIAGPKAQDPAAMATALKTLESMKQSAGDPQEAMEIDKLINTLVSAARGNPAQNNPSVFNQPPGPVAPPPNVQAQPPSMPPQRPLPDTVKVTPAEPSSKEQFEQVVSQMAKTDRAAAKAYYKKWMNKWQ